MSQHQSELLRRVGRNIVEFQRLETAYRALLPAMKVSGTLTEIDATFVETRRRLKTASLGKLTEEFGRSASTPSDSADEIAQVKDVMITFSVSYEPSDGDVRGWKRELKSLVAERNRLVHKDFTQFDFESPDACALMSEKLDKQSSRIASQLSLLGAFAAACEDGLSEVRRQLAGTRDDV